MLFFELVLPFLAPPLLGAAIGGLLGWAVQRRALAALVGAVGGVGGAWAGIGLYRAQVLPQGADLARFAAYLLVGLGVGASVLVVRAAKTAPHHRTVRPMG